VSHRVGNVLHLYRYTVPYRLGEPLPVARAAEELVTDWLRSRPHGFRVVNDAAPEQPAPGFFHATWVPRWTRLKPAVHVSVGVQALGKNSSRVTFAYTYAPLYGRLGEAVDGALLGTLLARGVAGRISRFAESLDAVAAE
jgi:hypothetical protein